MANTLEPADEPFLAQALGRIVAASIRRPVLVLVTAAVIAVIAGGYTVARLGYKTSRADLVSPHSEYHQRWLAYLDEFGSDDDAVVVVEANDPSAIPPALADVAALANERPALLHSVLWEVNLEPLRAKALHYLPKVELHELEQNLSSLSPALAGQWTHLTLGRQLQSLQFRARAATAQSPEAEALLVEAKLLVGDLQQSLADPEHRGSLLPLAGDAFAELDRLSKRQLVAEDGRWGFVLLKLRREPESFAPFGPAIEALRALLADVQTRHSGVRFGLTGLPVMEHDEMSSSQESMTWASGLSLALVGVLFAAGFGGLRHAVLANLVLLLGTAWAFGYATLSVGHLNILSVTFTVTLIGIGIDYGIHYVACYLQLRSDAVPVEEALVAAIRKVGPGIVTGAVTTSIAFFAAATTPFRGVAELGIVAGGGLLLCAIAELFVLPAAIVLYDRARPLAKQPQPLPVADWLTPLWQQPKLLFYSTAALTLAVACGLGWLRYDHNLLHLQPRGVESVALEERLLEESEQSVWYAVSVADTAAEALSRKEEFLQCPQVQRVDEIASLLPQSDSLQQALVSQIRERLAHLPDRAPLLPVERPEVLQSLLDGLAQSVQAAGGAELQTQIATLKQEFAARSAAEQFRVVSRWQQEAVSGLLASLHALQQLTDPQPPVPADLPAGLADRFLGRSGKYLLRVYGRGNIWDFAALEQFVTQVRSVDPEATGHPLQAFEASHEMKTSYERASLYALVIVLLVLYADFRSIKWSLMAAVPLAAGLTLTFGLLGLLDAPLNPANLIALPLILGIGVDYGVHIVHDFLAQRAESGAEATNGNTGRKYFGLSASTAVAVIVDSLTTIVGFGTLMLASHRGLASLGRVLTLGVSGCLFTSLAMLPPLLSMISATSKPRRAGGGVLVRVGGGRYSVDPPEAAVGSPHSPTEHARTADHAPLEGEAIRMTR